LDFIQFKPKKTWPARFTVQFSKIKSANLSCVQRGGPLKHRLTARATKISFCFRYHFITY